MLDPLVHDAIVAIIHPHPCKTEMIIHEKTVRRNGPSNKIGPSKESRWRDWNCRPLRRQTSIQTARPWRLAYNIHFLNKFSVLKK